MTNEQAERNGRATRVIADADIIRLPNGAYLVAYGRHYIVTEAGCSCPDFAFNCWREGLKCKHMVAVAEMKKLED